MAVLGPDTWNAGVEFTLTGISDGLPDGDTTYELEAGAVLSADPNFFGLVREYAFCR